MVCNYETSGSLLYMIAPLDDVFETIMQLILFGHVSAVRPLCVVRKWKELSTACLQRHTFELEACYAILPEPEMKLKLAVVPVE